MFAGPEYQWVERKRLVSWVARQWQHLQDWLDHLSEAYPTGFNIVLALLVVILVALLVHIGYVMWRIVRPAARTGTGGSASATGIVMDARAHLALAPILPCALTLLYYDLRVRREAFDLQILSDQLGTR